MFWVWFQARLLFEPWTPRVPMGWHISFFAAAFSCAGDSINVESRWFTNHLDLLGQRFWQRLWVPRKTWPVQSSFRPFLGSWRFTAWAVVRALDRISAQVIGFWTRQDCSGIGITMVITSRHHYIILLCWIISTWVSIDVRLSPAVRYLGRVPPDVTIMHPSMLLPVIPGCKFSIETISWGPKLFVRCLDRSFS